MGFTGECRECLIVDPSPIGEQLVSPGGCRVEENVPESQNITLGSFVGRPRSLKPREAGMAGMSHVDP
jgi:hypothetical protein